MLLAGGDEAVVAIGFNSTQIILTICSVISMVTLVTLCTCCKKVKPRDPDEVYGVANPAALSVVSVEASTSHCVQFRQTNRIDRINERHSQPATKCGVSGDECSSLRASAPLQMGRALPQLPADMYSVIDKGRKTNVPFADEGGIPMYESIDPENDSVIDPVYSKLGEVTSVRHERKYDYPVFSGRKISAMPLTHDDMVYQSASQIYTIGGSEDPYSSITSEPRRNGVIADRDEDSSGIYDPGYAKVKPEVSKSVRYKECIERTEREVDQLYSKIRRSPLGVSDEVASMPGPSRVTMDDIMEGDLEPELPQKISQVGDGESMSSREPSYRYITVRENADVVRERLRQQGQLAPPAREHYYSVIGNEYETVGDAQNSTYSGVRPPTNQGSLIVSTSTRQVEFVPPPPTSPIPDRTPNSGDMELPPSTSVSHSGDVRNPVYSVPNKPRVTSSATRNSSHEVSPKITGPLSGGVETDASLSMPSHSWNIASLKTATSFAGLDLTCTPSTSHNSTTCLGNNRNIMGAKDKEISEFMQRPLLPYGETLYSRRVTEERERIVENNRTRYNISSDFTSGLPRSLSFEPTLSTGVTGDAHNLSSLPVYNVEITHIDQCSENGGPSAYDIISGRRYRSLSTSKTSNGQGCSDEVSVLSRSADCVSQDESNLAGGREDFSNVSVERKESALHSNLASCRSSKCTLPVRAVNERLLRLNERLKPPHRKEMAKNGSLKQEKESSFRFHPSSRKSKAQTTTKPWKDETEEEKRRRLGTIYTAKDYISTIDLGTERPWPMSCSQSQSQGVTMHDSIHSSSDEQADNNNIGKTARDEG
ncbi:hypothetical protein KIN20_033566 [Parelaphostrongylus tenuis]|uniref:Uncharacterized protein n=1 Tax=Parelaphostrongylus tenuis TaxID=148309 RepID=A0AAD5R8A7_PARTN|nr:hypothetical protein KIN20_033566 [Parelaphostrongylus tenuis]